MPVVHDVTFSHVMTGEFQRYHVLEAYLRVMFVTLSYHSWSLIKKQKIQRISLSGETTVKPEN